MIIYLDSEYKCHVDYVEGYITATTSFFDGKCQTFIEGYRFVPKGYEWKCENGEVFVGEMFTPFVDYSSLAMAQMEADRITIQDMQEALELLNVSPTE